MINKYIYIPVSKTLDIVSWELWCRCIFILTSVLSLFLSFGQLGFFLDLIIGVGLSQLYYWFCWFTKWGYNTQIRKAKKRKIITSYFCWSDFSVYIFWDLLPAYVSIAIWVKWLNWILLLMLGIKWNCKLTVDFVACITCAIANLFGLQSYLFTLIYSVMIKSLSFRLFKRVAVFRLICAAMKTYDLLTLVIGLEWFCLYS